MKKVLLLLLFLASTAVYAQRTTITGTVSDEQGAPLTGATVQVKGTNMGTITDIDGKYSLEVPGPNSILVFSFVGYVQREVQVLNQTVVSITLRADVTGLEEVVVVGYSTQKRLNLTAAVDQVTSEALDNRSVTNLTQGLQGVLPNLNITLLDGRPNQAPNFNIRGTTSIGQGGSALILIDGVEGDPSMLNPNDIASVSVLKDAASASIYGARGAFGVVMITTKNPDKGKTSVTYTTNISTKKPVALPDFVTDGYTWVSMFVAAFLNGDGSFPQNINKTQKVSRHTWMLSGQKWNPGSPMTRWRSILQTANTFITEVPTGMICYIRKIHLLPKIIWQ